MLVLFVITFTILKKQQSEIEVEIEKLRKIVNLEKQFEPLKNNPDFIYDEKCQKFFIKDLMGVEIFETEQTIIKKEYENVVINSGKNIQTFINKLQKKNSEFSYLLVIEGNVANTWNNSYNKDNANSYEISYKRALALYNLWLKNNISFREYNVEVLICGSGLRGLCRDEKYEENNKRFSVQIIPKTSSFAME